MEDTNKKITDTIMAMITVLIFFSMQGTVIFLFRLTGAAARIIPGLILFSLSGAALIFFRLTKIPLRKVGFRQPEKSAFKKLFYLIPLIIVALSGLIGGIDMSKGMGYILSCLLYVAAIALSERDIVSAEEQQ